jgi:hypothetical protein
MKTLELFYEDLTEDAQKRYREFFNIAEDEVLDTIALFEIEDDYHRAPVTKG